MGGGGGALRVSPVCVSKVSLLLDQLVFGFEVFWAVFIFGRGLHSLNELLD